MLGWGIIAWIILGGIAGWIASKLMKTDASMGIPANIIAGILGGLLGGWILSALGVDVKGGGLIFSMLTAIAGACIVIFILKMIFGRRSRV